MFTNEHGGDLASAFKRHYNSLKNNKTLSILFLTALPTAESSKLVAANARVISSNFFTDLSYSGVLRNSGGCEFVGLRSLSAERFVMPTV